MIVQVNNSQNQVVVIQQQVEVVEVNSIGPQGEKGDKGEKGDTGATGGGGSTPTGSLSLTGSLIVSSSFVDFTNTTAISGSVFSGSFVGDGSGLTNISTTPFVSNETERDTLYPSPTNNQQIFNLRQHETETYSTASGLWLSPNIIVAIEDTRSISIDIRKLVFTNAGLVVNGFEYPALDYASSTSERGLVNGVVVQKGNVITNTGSFVAVAHFGKYFVDNSAPITIGHNIYSTTNTSGDALGAAFAQTGTVGKAIQTSGVDAVYTGSVFVQLNLI